MDMCGLEGDSEQALWLSFLYVAYYHIGSAWATFRDCPHPSPIDTLSMLKRPTGIDRRGLRDPICMQAHITSWCEIACKYRGQDRWLSDGWPRPNDPVENYYIVSERLQEVAFNGRWAAFTMTEILKTVHRWPLQAPDMRLQHASGPREGLAWLYGVPTTTPIPILDGYGEDLSDRFTTRGLTIPWERLESVLCDFNNVRQGRYYLGKRIDGQQTQISGPAFMDRALQQPLWRARAKRMPHEYLGEIGGWLGVDHEREKAFVRTGQIITRQGW
jgi:hypothetical protein